MAENPGDMVWPGENFGVFIPETSTENGQFRVVVLRLDLAWLVAVVATFTAELCS